MTAKNHALFWGCISAGFLAFVYLFKSILLPFVLGIAVAYLLNPLVNKFGRGGFSRSTAALIILFGFFLVVGAAFAAVIPILYKELSQFSAELPGYIERLTVFFLPFSQKIQTLVGFENGFDIQALMAEHAGTGLDITQHVASKLAAGGSAMLNMLSVVIFTPIVAYFMMKEWEAILAWGTDLMPRDHKKVIKNLFVQIDQKLSGFVRGQISVAVILGLAYAIGLSLLGLKYGFLVGFSAGLLSIIPMVGSAVGLVVGMLMAWFQAGDITFVIMVAGVFLAGQVIEGNFLTPKLVGDSVGLHPLWVFFALLAGGALFGILGMLLAVPVAAVAGVLIAFAITQYKKSAYFRGSHGKQKAKKKRPMKKKVKRAK